MLVILSVAFQCFLPTFKISFEKYDSSFSFWWYIDKYFISSGVYNVFEFYCDIISCEYLYVYEWVFYCGISQKTVYKFKGFSEKLISNNNFMYDIVWRGTVSVISLRWPQHINSIRVYIIRFLQLISQ